MTFYFHVTTHTRLYSFCYVQDKQGGHLQYLLLRNGRACKKMNSQPHSRTSVLLMASDLVKHTLNITIQYEKNLPFNTMMIRKNLVTVTLIFKDWCSFIVALEGFFPLWQTNPHSHRQPSTQDLLPPATVCQGGINRWRENLFLHYLDYLFFSISKVITNNFQVSKSIMIFTSRKKAGGVAGRGFSATVIVFLEMRVLLSSPGFLSHLLFLAWCQGPDSRFFYIVIDIMFHSFTSFHVREIADKLYIFILHVTFRFVTYHCQ